MEIYSSEENITAVLSRTVGKKPSDSFLLLKIDVFNWLEKNLTVLDNVLIKHRKWPGQLFDKTIKNQQ